MTSPKVNTSLPKPRRKGPGSGISSIRRRSRGGKVALRQLRGEQPRQLLEGVALLELLDGADAGEDAFPGEESFLTGEGGLLDEPILGDEAFPLPAVELAVGDAGLGQQLFFGDEFQGNRPLS